jgi:hypothetical protein
VFSFVPLFINLLWINAAQSGNTQEERLIIFNAYFPNALSLQMLNVIVIVCCISAIIFSSLALAKSTMLGKIINFTIILLSIFMLLLKVWAVL